MSFPSFYFQLVGGTASLGILSWAFPNPIHTKPEHRLSWMEILVVGLSSAYTDSYMSDCVDPRWGEQVKAVERLWYLMWS